MTNLLPSQQENLPPADPSQFPVSVGELRTYLPHRPPMVWVDEVLSTARGENGLAGTVKIELRRDRSFFDAAGSLRPSAVVEWIAQGYGFAKACRRREDGFGLAGFGRAFLVAISNCDVDLSGIEGQPAVLVHVSEVREMHPAYIVDGRVTSLDGAREFGRARITVFGGEIPGQPQEQ